MPLTSPKELLADAYRNRYAVAAFAAHNMEMMRAVVEAAEEAGAPVILQTTPATLRYAGLESIVAMARAAAEGAKVPVALHLDHGDTFETVVRCLRAGYTSVMVDASRLPFLENAAFVAKVTEAAHAAGVPVEAELGTIGGAEEGGAGEEDLPIPRRRKSSCEGRASISWPRPSEPSTGYTREKSGWISLAWKPSPAASAFPL